MKGPQRSSGVRLPCGLNEPRCNDVDGRPHTIFSPERAGSPEAMPTTLPGMAPRYMRRRRVAVLAVVLTASAAFAAYKSATRTPEIVVRAAIGAVRADNPGQDDDEWRVKCDDKGERTYMCIVTWKQVGITPADGLGEDFCEDFSVQVRNGRETTTPVRLEDRGVSLRRC